LTPQTGKWVTYGLYKTTYKTKITTTITEEIHYERVCINGTLTTLDPVKKTTSVEETKEYKKPDITFEVHYGAEFHNIVGMPIMVP